jgi:hypothetical protein
VALCTRAATASAPRAAVGRRDWYDEDEWPEEPEDEGRSEWLGYDDEAHDGCEYNRSEWPLYEADRHEYNPPNPPYPFGKLHMGANAWVWQMLVALGLGYTPEEFLRLLDGYPVPPDYLDDEWHEWFRRTGVLPHGTGAARGDEGRKADVSVFECIPAELRERKVGRLSVRAPQRQIREGALPRRRSRQGVLNQPDHLGDVRGGGCGSARLRRNRVRVHARGPVLRCGSEHRASRG